VKIYRTTRYNSTGQRLWTRYSSNAGKYGATVADLLQAGERVTLEVAELDDDAFELTRDTRKGKK
jgi:hypothetical protein